MQVTNSNNLTDTIIVTPQDTKSVSCELSNNGTLFDILSNSLYADKILAVIREILCNAWDSHIVNNKTDTPLEVTLTDYEFSVRDFGSGIDPEKILQIYGTYGQSTKTDDEKQVGGFGIGSKAPFAYTDTFTVTNVYKNTKYVYILTKEPNQAPTIKTVYSGITDEPTGLKVAIVLKKNDFYDFTCKINNFISKSDIKICLNGILTEINDFSNTYCFIQDTHSDFLNVYVKYNSVSYKIDLNNIFINNDLREIIFSYIAKFKFKTLILNALPNTLDVSATREGLSYTKKTQDTLKVLINNFEQHITNYLTNNIQNVYKNIYTAKDYFKYVEEMTEFTNKKSYISKDKDFLNYLVFYLSEIYNPTLLKNVLNISEHYRKILFSRIFNIKLSKLKRSSLLNSTIINLLPNIIYINTQYNRQKVNHIYDTLPNLLYIVTNKSTPIPLEHNNVRVPVVLTSLKEKDNLINKLTDFGFDCDFVSSPKKEKTVIKQEKDLIYARLISTKYVYNNYTHRHLKLEPNSYIIYRNSEHCLFREIMLPYLDTLSLKNNELVYEIYYKKDFDLLIKEGHIDLEKEIESEEFFKKHSDLNFLKKIYLNFQTYDVRINFSYFITNNNDNFELIKTKKWKLFFQKYKELFTIIKMYQNFIQSSPDKLKKIANTKNNLEFYNLLKNKELKKIIDYKKLNQYILNGKIKQVINLLDLIKE